MKDGRYHKELFWNEEFENIITYKIQKRLQQNRCDITFSEHTKRQALQGYNRQYDLDSISIGLLLSGSIFEVEYINNRLVKFVVRCKYTNKHDVCIAVMFKPQSGLFIKTIWLNCVSDTHKTLDKDNYILALSLLI